MSIKVPIGERARSFRKAKGWTQRELAERVGVTVLTVSNWERGAKEPRYSQLRALAAALGVTIDELAAAPPRSPSPVRFEGVGGEFLRDLRELGSANGSGAGGEQAARRLLASVVDELDKDDRTVQGMECLLPSNPPA